jgi:glycosyltransferase involved in cell wall biosynthesis
VFHTYGDFLLPFPEYWVTLSEALQNFKVTFLNASHRQAKYFQQFINQTSINLICPFPVNPSEFFYSKEERKTYRSKLGLCEEDFVWLYAGRLSYQKNIIKLIKNFALYKKHTGSSDKLFLAGAFDSVGVPYLEILQQEHEYFYSYNQALLGLDEHIRKDICHLGVYYGHELNGVYNSADAFISLSTYNDEDFGMAVAEALSTGLPCLLTDWAGYSSFAKYAPVNRVKLLAIKLEQGQLNFSKDNLIQMMLKIKGLNKSREQASRAAYASFGTKAVGSILKEIFAQKVPSFKGFSHNLNILSNRWSKGHTFCTAEKSYNAYYKKIYETYFR